MSNREFLQLAQTYDPKKHLIAGCFASEKLDGMRAFWDGGITRGMKCSDVPFANVAKDHVRLHAPIATGLWSRYGKPIHAPQEWINELPNLPLDGELYLGRGKFQELISVTKTYIPGPQWQRIKYHVFDAPVYQEVFCNGRINNPNFQKVFTDIVPWIANGHKATWATPRKFCENVDYIKQFHNEVVKAHKQVRLSLLETKAKDAMHRMLDAIIHEGGEGLMLRRSMSYWTPKRTDTLLKVKALNDSEAVVMGYIWGRETDKGSKLLGLMGAMVVDWKGKKFELSGFTDLERRMSQFDPNHPGEEVHPTVYNPMFPRGTIVTFRYRELTMDGIPKEARYWRKFDT